MTWNYRIIHHDKDKYPHFAVHEVFYDTDGKVESWTVNPIDVSGENKTEVIKLIEMVIKDIRNAPILIESQLEESLHDIINTL